MLSSAAQSIQGPSSTGPHAHDLTAVGLSLLVPVSLHKPASFSRNSFLSPLSPVALMDLTFKWRVCLLRHCPGTSCGISLLQGMWIIKPTNISCHLLGNSISNNPIGSKEPLSQTKRLALKAAGKFCVCRRLLFQKQLSGFEPLPSSPRLANAQLRLVFPATARPDRANEPVNHLPETSPTQLAINSLIATRTTLIPPLNNSVPASVPHSFAN